MHIAPFLSQPLICMYECILRHIWLVLFSNDHCFVSHIKLFHLVNNICLVLFPSYHWSVSHLEYISHSEELSIYVFKGSEDKYVLFCFPFTIVLFPT